jgi:hypothetical protein
MTFQEQIEALPEAERTKFFRGLMAVAEAGRQAGVPPEELAKMYANTYNEVEKNMKDDKLKPRTVLTSAGYIADEDDDIQVYQRPWVGLTEEEVDTIYQRHGTPKGFAKAIEAKLKEKNT